MLSSVIPTSRRRMTGEARREQILDVTHAIVDVEGFHAATPNRVAEQAGVNRSLIYQQFGSPAGLFVALIDREAGRAAAQFNNAITGSENPDSEGFLAGCSMACCAPPTAIPRPGGCSCFRLCGRRRSCTSAWRARRRPFGRSSPENCCAAFPIWSILITRPAWWPLSAASCCNCGSAIPTRPPRAAAGAAANAAFRRREPVCAGVSELSSRRSARRSCADSRRASPATGRR